MNKSNQTSIEARSPAPTQLHKQGWIIVIVGALVMLATLPGRTQGLGLITEPLIADLKLDRLTYASLNLWATLAGAIFCFPAGWLIDRLGLRLVTAAVAALLGFIVWKLSTFAGSVAFLFILLTLTRALGQSALSVSSITTVGKWFKERAGWPMGIYSVLLSLFFAVAFGVIGYSVRVNGWRAAWHQIALFLLLGVVPIILCFLREPPQTKDINGDNTELKPKLKGSFTLSQALRTRAFWIFGLAAALFNLVSSGLGLFNEAVLAERGFSQKTFHIFLIVTTLLSLIGQFICGWLSNHWTFRKLTAVALTFYAVGLAGLPFATGPLHLWPLAAILGLAGGMIIVVFFSVWSAAFGHENLGRIQGAAQMLTIVSSAIGPVLFAKCFVISGSYAPLLLGLAVLVLIVAVISSKIPMPKLAA